MSDQQKPQPYTLDTFTMQSPIRSSTKQIQKSICIRQLKHIWHKLPREILKQFPSTLSTFTSIPLDQSTRTDTTNRFSIHEFQIYLQGKLRLPLHPHPPTTCTYGNPIDNFGDHFFTFLGKFLYIIL